MGKRYVATEAPGSAVLNGAPAAIDDSEGVAARRELFLAHARASRRVALYIFIMPPHARAPAVGGSGRLANPRDQLTLIVALTGGAITKSAGGLLARIPIAAAKHFESLSRPLIEGFLVAFQREGLDIPPALQPASTESPEGD